MRAYDCKVLLCATAIILSCVSSGAEARYWRHYGDHWYGRSWNGFRPNGDERQVEKQLPSTEPRNEPRNQGDFSAAIEEMIHACDVQVQELRNMPLDGVAEMVKPTEQQRDALEQVRSTEPRNEPRNQGDFSAAIEEMIHACDVQVQELRNMPLDGVAEMVKPTEQQRDALEQVRSAALSEF